jgi:hypothetical protein
MGGITPVTTWATLLGRKAVVLVGGNKAGDKRFYATLIPLADARFEKYLRQMENQRRDSHKE